MTGNGPAHESASERDIALEHPAAGVLLVRLQRPRVRNALRTRTLEQIAEVLFEADRDDRIRVAVITGSPQVFAAGADLHEVAALDSEAARKDPRPKHWAALRAFSKPLIAAVDGPALGAGCELALLADLVVASSQARFGQPEIKLGIIPGAGGIQRLVRTAGKALAMKLVLTGETLDPTQAFAAGLLSEVTDEPSALPRAIELAGAIAGRSPLAVKAAKALVYRAYETGLEQGLAEERAAFCSLMDSPQKREGIAAFLEKRSS